MLKFKCLSEGKEVTIEEVIDEIENKRNGGQLNPKGKFYLWDLSTQTARVLFMSPGSRDIEWDIYNSTKEYSYNKAALRNKQP